MIAADNTELLSGESPELVLVAATPEERIKSIKLNSMAWKGRLDVDTYIARENHLHQQRLVKDGLTCWILVDRREKEGERTILSSCETYKKKAVRAFSGLLWENIPTYGIGSVFCRPEYRGKGYAKRMLQELCRKLDMWGMSPDYKSRPVFSVLFSDIGKNFYAQFGWKPFPSSHISLPPLTKEEYDRPVAANLPKARTLGANDVQDCMCSEEILQKERELLRVASESDRIERVAILPDFDHFVWHWAREEFYVEKLHADMAPPQIKGAGEDQARVYCAWTRNFGDTPQDNTLYILRWVYNEPTTPEETEATAKAMAAILRRAQLEAHEWNMAKVDFWNPTPLLQKAVDMLDSAAELIHREKSSIASLRWQGDISDDHEVEWIWNEKYTWC